MPVVSIAYKTEFIEEQETDRRLLLEPVADEDRPFQIDVKIEFPLPTVAGIA